MTPEDPENMSFSLEAIVDYKMSAQEAKAYKVCIIWMTLCNKLIPEYKYIKLPAKGDPRKGSLFRSAWKLVRETTGILKDEEIVNYVRAQIEILRSIRLEGDLHVNIDPTCLTGEKAWVRWKIWQKKLNQANKTIVQVRTEEAKTPLFKIAQELDRTKTFLQRFYDPFMDQDQAADAVKTNLMNKWLTLGKISPYYILISPFVRKSLKGTKVADHFTGIDLGLYLPDITLEVVDLMKTKFPHEFEK